MIVKKIKIRNNIGLHARPAAMIAEEASKYESSILVFYGGQTVSAKSPVALLSLGIECNRQFYIFVEGKDQHEAWKAIKSVLRKINKEDNSVFLGDKM